MIQQTRDKRGLPQEEITGHSRHFGAFSIEMLTKTRKIRTIPVRVASKWEATVYSKISTD